mgnify:CR=1 FL=1
MKRYLVLEDGSFYEGEALGSNCYSTGELLWSDCYDDISFDWKLRYQP